MNYLQPTFKISSRNTLAEKKLILAKHEDSGLSVKDFCSYHSISPSLFYKIRNQVRRSNVEQEQKEQPTHHFLELKAPKAQDVVTLVLGELEFHFPPSLLPEVIAHLKNS